MRRLWFIAICALIGFFAVAGAGLKYKINKDITQPIERPTVYPTITKPQVRSYGKVKKSEFVPYWSTSNDLIETKDMDDLIYFGINPSGAGLSDIDKENLQKFNDLRPAEVPAKISVRMTNSQSNLSILADEEKEKEVVETAVESAVSNNMNGVVLDLEISAIPLDSLTKQISKFSKMFYEACKRENLKYAVILYGDTFFRARPYDVKNLGENSDEIMIMAYDFHKAGGNPGPNFPLSGSEKYGYDMGKMADDFSGQVPASKLTVVFGLYGYDWTVDDKNNATEAGKAITLAQVKNKFINDKQIRDKLSGEAKIEYRDSDGNKHVVWFEDMESIKNKENFLKQKGISSFGYWAYGYY